MCWEWFVVHVTAIYKGVGAQLVKYPSVRYESHPCYLVVLWGKVDDATWWVFSPELCNTSSAQGVSVLCLMPFGLMRWRSWRSITWLVSVIESDQNSLAKAWTQGLVLPLPVRPFPKHQGSFKPWFCYLPSLNENRWGYYFSAVCPSSF